MINLLGSSGKPRKKLWSLLILGLATTIFIIATAVKISPIFIGDFETGDFSGWEAQFCCEYSGEIVSSPTRAGNYAAKFTLNKNDPLVKGGKRAELKQRGVALKGSEYWYGFSVYLPNDWVEDTASEIVAQWHDIPDVWFGETWRRPPFSLSINGKNWRIGNAWDPKIVTDKNNVAGSEMLWSGPFEREVWTDWVFHVKWSHQSDGLIEVWKNGTKIVTKHGRITYNDLLVPYFKLGPYKYPWKNDKPASVTNKRVIYYDEARIGNASASYEDIAPKS